MPSPTRSASLSHIRAIGPPSSLLQRLLQEINDNDAPRSDPIFPTIDGSDSANSYLSHSATSRRASLNCSLTSPQHRATSAWAKGGPIAEEARLKLRALDEARLHKHSTSAAQSDNPTAALPSPPIFADIKYKRAATFFETYPPTSNKHLIDFSRAKRERSGVYSPEFRTKKLRHEHCPDMVGHECEVCSPNQPPEDRLRGGGSVVTTQVQSETPDDPVLQLGPLPDTPSPQYGFRSTPKHAYKPFRPTTPHRSPTPSEEGSPRGTPTWARPLQLVEDGISIYKNVHGERSQEHPLCLYCFRQHGEFHRMFNHHCETCGQNEILEGHYWEAPFWGL